MLKKGKALNQNVISRDNYILGLKHIAPRHFRFAMVGIVAVEKGIEC
jgi:hypothetical protein